MLEFVACNEVQTEVVHEHLRFQAGHIRGTNLLAYVRSGIQQYGFRVVNQALNALTGKVRQDTYYHSLVRYHSQENRSPVRAVTSAQGNLVAGLDA